MSHLIFSGIDIEHLSAMATGSLEIDDIARKALHIRNIIQRTQDSLRAIDRVSSALSLYPS